MEVQDSVMMSVSSELCYHFIKQDALLNVWLCVGIFQSDIINHPQKVGLEGKKWWKFKIILINLHSPFYMVNQFEWLKFVLSSGESTKIDILMEKYERFGRTIQHSNDEKRQGMDF